MWKFGEIELHLSCRFSWCQVWNTYLCNAVNTSRPIQNGLSFPDDIFKCIFLNENVWNSIKISLKSVSRGPIYNIQALVQIMAWRRPGDKPLSEPMLVTLPTHICVTRPQWVNRRYLCISYCGILKKTPNRFKTAWSIDLLFPDSNTPSQSTTTTGNWLTQNLGNLFIPRHGICWTRCSGCLYIDRAPRFRIHLIMLRLYVTKKFNWFRLLPRD